MKALFAVLVGLAGTVVTAVATALSAGTPVKAAVVGALTAGAAALLGWLLRTYGPKPAE